MTRIRDRWADRGNGLARFWLARLQAMPIAMAARFLHALARRTAERVADGVPDRTTGRPRT
ncbi:hypothetical protein SAMN04489712_101733 [Thermomonospora echinospora]|uniref:Uncharacterized protein n=1 Tax=Thermomonospora echinospora TaxID=1992 RepID=A0A1H5TSJ3_9ACTN|nr:hypothetical protein [Thermomonospora echinospora]SEF65852.1 hypothetical protein SAMN04489712_101733 [Thermomonospora echinospora]